MLRSEILTVYFQARIEREKEAVNSEMRQW